VWAGDNVSADLVERARTCGVFSGTIDQVNSSVLDGSLEEAEGEKLLSPLVAACENKLPLAPFEDKLAEGLAKHIPPLLIARALNKKLDEYKFAKGLLGAPAKDADPQLLIVLGEGLSKGVPRQDFEGYVSSYGDQASEPFLVGMEMASLLSQAGFDYKLTSSILDAGFAANSLSPQWRYFIRIVLVARQRGLSDDFIAEAAKGVLGDGGSLGDASTRLGFTSRDLTGRDISN